MKTITETFNVYTFDELPEEIKIEVLEKVKQKNSDDYCEFWLSDDMKEKARELLSETFPDHEITFKRVYYDFSYSQGSGSMVEFTISNKDYEYTVKQYGHYNHERSFTSELQWYNEESYTEEKYDITEKELDEKTYLMNKKLTKYGYECIENSYDDEYALENAKEYEYLIDGTVYYE